MAGARHVWVRGTGAISPLGADWPSTAARLARGETAVAHVTRFDVEGFPCTVAAALPAEFESLLEKTEDRRLALARVAAREAWTIHGVEAKRLGVFVGAESGRASLSTVLALSRAAGGGATFDHRLFGERASPLVERFEASTASPATVASALARQIGALGPARTISIACASGAAAIVEAARAIRLGIVDAALAGGVGADVDPLMISGFGKLGALSAKGASCPFDRRRDGFVVGEGAAFVALSSERGEARAEITGGGRSLDAHHLTAPDPEGDGAARSMRAALAEAGLDSVDYIQAHGTSTPLNDAVEASAIRKVFGARTDSIRVGAVKGAVGHWVAGAGAIGFLCALHAVTEGELLPTAGLETPDSKCALGHVMGGAVRADARRALVNAFAFGGANASIVVERAS